MEIATPKQVRTLSLITIIAAISNPTVFVGSTANNHFREVEYQVDMQLVDEIDSLLAENLLNSV